MSDYLSTLPVELLHMILNHLPMGDILTSICFVNKRLRVICLSYPHFHFDSTSSGKTKEQFELICAHLPHVSFQIHSLTFSERGNRFVSFKITRFFSQFNTLNDTFSKLHSITLCSTNFETWYSINNRLTSLPSLVSLSIDSFDLSNAPDILMISELLRNLLFNSQTLKRLSVKTSVSGSDVFIVDPHPTATKSLIEHLILQGVRIVLNSLLAVTPKLKTLDTVLNVRQFAPDTRLHPPHTMRHLTIRVYHVTMEEIKYMLQSMTQLTHFTIIGTDVIYDIANGITWSRLLKTVITFKFKFIFDQSTFTQPPIDLESFRTSFWLEEKHWYVRYDRCIDTGYSLLYSIPYCDDDYRLFYMQDSIITTSTASTSTSLPHNDLLIVEYTDPRVSKILSEHTRIKRSSLENCGATLDAKLRYAATYIDLSQIKFLFAFRYEADMLNDVFVRFVRNLPRLRILSLSTVLLKLLLNHQWPNISDLRLPSTAFDISEPLTLCEMNAFCRSFTQLENLTILLDTFCDLSQFFNNIMSTLSHISIVQKGDENIVSNDRIIQRNWIEENTQLRNFYYSCDRNNTVNLWL